jgi:hypothetical protein
LGHTTKRILSHEAYKSGRVKHSKQDGSREFISLLACICADGTALPPALIYTGESHDLQDTWVEDLGDETAYFAASDNGWSCDDLGLQWLLKVFERHTKTKAGRSKRLLIVDGHSSHVNIKFLDTADRLRIIVHIMPPHSTHRLQPLDVGLFGPLSTAYNNALNNLMHRSLGMVYMSKRLFWPMFKEAWEIAFTSKNILHSFEKTGIFPYNPSKILHILQKENEEQVAPVPENTLQTPTSCRAVRRVHRVFKQDPSVQNLGLILRANVRLAAEKSIQAHVIQGLAEAFKLEKKKRQRGKRLNLIGENDSGPQFFSPARIQAARAFQAQKVDAETARKKQIADKKAATTVVKQQKEADKAARAVQRDLNRQFMIEVKAQQVAERAAIKAAKVVAKEQEKLLNQVPNPISNRLKTPRKTVAMSRTPIGSRKVAKKVVAIAPVVLRTPTTSNRGRAIILPQRFH